MKCFMCNAIVDVTGPAHLCSIEVGGFASGTFSPSITVEEHIKAAVLAERERCALIAATLIRPRAGDSVGAATGYEIASKIREG